jgi:hypothetical protein
MHAAHAEKPSLRYVGTQTLRRFRTEFQIYFPPALLVCAAAYLCIYLLGLMQDQLVVPSSYESIMEPTRSAAPRFLYVLARELASAIQWLVVWLAFAFMLAAVALRMLGERQSPDEMIRMGEAFQLVLSRRLSVLIGASALGALASIVFNLFLLPLLLRVLPLILFQLNSFRYYLTVYVWAAAVLRLVFAALLVKMTLAIPELVDDQNVSLVQSIRNSVAITTGWETFFFLEFGVFGVIGGAFYFSGKNLLEASWKHGQLTFTGYELTLAAFTIVLVSIMLALFSIAHSLLYISLRYGAAPLRAEAAHSEV